MKARFLVEIDFDAFITNHFNGEQRRLLSSNPSEADKERRMLIEELKESLGECLRDLSCDGLDIDGDSIVHHGVRLNDYDEDDEDAEEADPDLFEVEILCTIKDPELILFDEDSHR